MLLVASEYHEHGRAAEAQRLRDRAIAGWRRIADERIRQLGPIHPDTVEARERHADLAAVWAGRRDELAAELEQIAADHEAAFGAGHPRTLHAQVDLVRRLGWNNPRAVAPAEDLIEPVYTATETNYDDVEYLQGVTVTPATRGSAEWPRRAKTSRHQRGGSGLRGGFGHPQSPKRTA